MAAATSGNSSFLDYDWSLVSGVTSTRRTLNKYIIIGDMGTGKSSILQRFINHQYVRDVQHTIGVEFGSRSVQVDGVKLKLQIWDTAGQERFRSVTRSYYRGSAGCIIVYDITQRSTFAHVPSWLADARSSTSPHCVITLIGSKSDLESERAVSYEEALNFARENNLLFAEASAKSGDAVEEAFIESARRTHQLILSGTINPSRPNFGVQRRRTNAQVDLPSLNNVYGAGQTYDAAGSSSNCACRV